MITIKGIKDDIDAGIILGQVGYVNHRNGSSVSGWVKDIDERRRWHAYYENGKVSIHKDLTIHGHHKVVRDSRPERIEQALIYQAVERFYKKPTKKQKTLPPIYAPNLREIQKFKTPLPKPTLLDKLKSLWK